MKELWMETDLKSFPTVMEANADFFLQNDPNNKIGIRVFDGGVPFNLSGTPSILLIKPNNTTSQITQNGSISGNQLVFNSLPSSVYQQTGPIQLAIRITDQGNTTTLAIVKGFVYPSSI